MMLKSLLVAIFCCCSCATFAQKTYGVKGTLFDTFSNTKVHNATVTVLSAKDSVVQKTVHSVNGRFEVGNLKSGEFHLVVTGPNYADFVSSFLLTEASPVHDFGNIKMISKSKLLEEVVIKSRVASMKLKGDTTEFNAAAYKTQKHAKADDLLKQLNGIRIDQKGEISFQGERIGKILIDGAEFFADDPKLVSKTIRADMVGRIQVYDQKSDNAKLTGIDDGIKVKTVNFVLTEDKKKGVFGKLEAGPGTDGYYEARGSLSRFDPKQKLSLFGGTGNTDKIGSSAGEFTLYGRPGIPAARELGMHYDTKWNRDRESVYLVYRLDDVGVELLSNARIRNNLPGNFSTSIQDGAVRTSNISHNVNGTFNAKIDSLSELRMRISGSKRKYANQSSSYGSTVRGNGMLQNSAAATSIDNSKSEDFGGEASFARRFKKKGRQLSVNASSNFSDTKGDSYLDSRLDFYNGQGRVDSVGKVDQYKPNLNSSKSFRAGFSYADVWSRSLSFNAGYSFSWSENHNSLRTFNSLSLDGYHQLDSAFSSDFRLISQSGSYSASLAYSAIKLSANIGTSVADAGFRQTDLFSAVALDRSFVLWTPSAAVQLKIGKSSSLNVRYSGRTGQPRAEQLQELRRNNDPLNISLGNAGLRPSFTNDLSFNYRIHQSGADRGVNFYGSYALTSREIITNRFTDSAGVNFYRYENLYDRVQRSWNISTEAYGHATGMDFVLSVSLNAKGSTNFNYVNGELNRVSLVEYRPRIEISKNKEHHNYRFSVEPNYLLNSSSLQTLSNNSKGFSASLSYFTTLPLKFFMGSDVNYRFVGKNEIFERNFEQLIVNSSFGKSFLKNESLKLTVKVNDLLNQNKGYYRDGRSDSFRELRNTTISRYFMFSASWDFARFGKSFQVQ